MAFDGQFHRKNGHFHGHLLKTLKRPNAPILGSLSSNLGSFPLLSKFSENGHLMGKIF
jgi:hypothetical protein